MSGAKLAVALNSRRVQLPTGGITRSSAQLAPTDAAAGFRLHTDGTIDATPDQATALNYTDDLGPWLLKGTASDYEAKVDNASPNALQGQAENTWLNCGSAIRDWFAQITGAGIRDCGSTLRIRDATTLVELASCQISMYAEASN